MSFRRPRSWRSRMAPPLLLSLGVGTLVVALTQRSFTAWWDLSLLMIAIFLIAGSAQILVDRLIGEPVRATLAVNTAQARPSRGKDDLLASMGHELRTPLNAILALSEALQEQVYGPLTDRQRQSLRTIEDSGRDLLALINDIVDLFRIEVGKLTLEIAPVPVEAICQACLRLVRQSAFHKRLQVSLAVDKAVSTIHADQRRLKQMLVNLLTNAVKFTPERGTIGLEVARNGERHVRFTVWDTGVGISPADRAPLSQPSDQRDLSNPFPGTEPGLALVWRLVELHGGSVTVESVVGQGSRFTMSLPWMPEGAPEPIRLAAATPRPSTGGLTVFPNSPRILLAEDNESNIQVLSHYLTARGCRLCVARHGVEVMRQAEKDKPDLILLDVEMPGLDGLEAGRRLRAIASLAHIPIIFLTALAMPGDRDRCLAAGGNDYLTKPVRLLDLGKAIEAQLNHPGK
jgi:signal transduction histidine kinase/ActR/RegA family two-component response regulator